MRAHPDTLFLDVDVRAGDVIPDLRDNHERIGWLAVTGPDGDAAVKLCDELVTDSPRIEVAGA